MEAAARGLATGHLDRIEGEMNVRHSIAPAMLRIGSTAIWEFGHAGGAPTWMSSAPVGRRLDGSDARSSGRCARQKCRPAGAATHGLVVPNRTCGAMSAWSPWSGFHSAW